MTNDQYDIVRTFVVSKFNGMKDKGGNDYVDHLLYVSQNAYKLGLELGFNDSQVNDVIVVGLLHDVIEDCAVSVEQLTLLSSSENINRVQTLTRAKSVAYSEYFNKIKESNDSVVILVKAVDCFHNSLIDRLNKQHIDKQDIDRCKKYLKRANKLLTILNKKYNKDITFNCLL